MRAAKELSGGKALGFVDAVHYAPHGKLDVDSIGCDFLACSPYKFFGPHSGMLFGRRELLSTLPVDRFDCQDDRLPNEDNCFMSRWEVGTQNYEALAGVTAAVDYLADLGVRFGGADAKADRCTRLEVAFRAISAHECELTTRFLEGVSALKGVSVVMGVTNPAQANLRTPTFAVQKDGIHPWELAERLSARGVWCTAGNHYAGFWEKHSGGRVANDIGATRIGFLHYNTLGDIDKVLQVLDEV